MSSSTSESPPRRPFVSPETDKNVLKQKVLPLSVDILSQMAGGGGFCFNLCVPVKDDGRDDVPPPPTALKEVGIDYHCELHVALEALWNTPSLTNMFNFVQTKGAKVLFNLALAMQAEGQLVGDFLVFSCESPTNNRYTDFQVEACSLYEQVVAEDNNYHDAWYNSVVLF
jgi:hypothetical protein